MDKIMKQKLFIGVDYKKETLPILKYYPKWGPHGVPQFQGIGKYLKVAQN